MTPASSRLIRGLLLSLLAVLGACASQPEPGTPGGPERATFRGLLTFDDDGDAKLEDCASRSRVTLGGMTDGHYLYLRRRHGEVSRRSTEPVTAEISGYLSRRSKGLHLDRAAPLWVAEGFCVDEGDGYVDYN